MVMTAPTPPVTTQVGNDQPVRIGETLHHAVPAVPVIHQQRARGGVQVGAGGLGKWSGVEVVDHPADAQAVLDEHHRERHADDDAESAGVPEDRRDLHRGEQAEREQHDAEVDGTEDARGQ